MHWNSVRGLPLGWDWFWNGHKVIEQTMGGCSQSTSSFTSTTNLDEIGLNQKLISHSVYITKPKVHNKREESIECSYIVRSMYVESYALGMPIIAIPPRILVR